MAFIGIDLGGTKIRAAITDVNGSIIAEIVEKTRPAGGHQVVSQLAMMSKSLARNTRTPWKAIQRVGVGSPGLVRPDGTIHYASNLKGFDTLRLGALLTKALRTTVVIENDANVAAVGEGTFGVAVGCQNYAVMSIGTGTGLGLIAEGELIRGSRGGAGEIAFLPIGGNPQLPRSRSGGTLESAASGPAMLGHARQLRELHPGTVLTSRCTVQDIFDHPDDVVAHLVIEREAALLAKAILCISSIVDPELVVLAGGVGARAELLQPVRQYADLILPFRLRIETSTLGNRSGLLGAVALAVQNSLETQPKAQPQI